VSAPVSVEGLAAWHIATRPGLKHFAGMTGVIVGLDWPALMALAAADNIPAQIASHLFESIEAAMLMAIHGPDEADPS
jgi:hypothetical protein